MTARRVGKLSTLGLALLVWSYIGWDGAMWDSRLQLVLHLGAVAALIGLLVLGMRGGALPRTRLDVPILALLLAFALASLGAWNPGLSARALAGIVATVAMLPVALVALRDRPAWTALVVTLPILALAAGSLAVLAWRRLEWVLASAPGLPPVRMEREGTPFGSVAVPPFVLLAALPLALLIPHPRWRLGVTLALLAVGLPLTLLSGSRSAWIAVAVAAAVLAAPALWGRLPAWRARSDWTLRRVAVGVAGLALFGLAIYFVAPRIAESGSFSYRLALWRDTLLAWASDPWLGIGPGSMQFARQVAAPSLSVPVRQPHSHNVPMGILGDAGIVGLVAAIALFVALVAIAGPWRTRRLSGRAAFAVLMGFAAGMLFEDLTFLPNLNLLILLLTAVALMDADAVTWSRLRVTRMRAGVAAAVALPLLVVMAVGDAGAVAYRFGADAAEDLRWHDATAWFARSEALDAWHPTTPRALAVAADRAGQPRLALRAAREAAQLNPGDGVAWTNLALLCLADGDAACARHAANRAIARATPGVELVNAALVHDALGDAVGADRAYRLSAQANYWTTLTYPWPRPIHPGRAELSEVGSLEELNDVIARGALGTPIDPDRYRGVHARALAFAVLGEWDAATAEIARAKSLARAQSITWDLAALVERHLGGDASDELRISDVARGEPLPTGPAGVPRLTYDISIFRVHPADGLVAAAERMLPDTPWPWVLEPLLAAP